MTHSTLFGILSIGVLVGLAGCGERAAQTAAVKVEAGEKQAEQVSSGRPEAPFIDPEKKSVTVLIAPTEPQRLEQRQASLQADSERREAAIHTLMDRYAENLGSPVGKERYEQQIATELDAYKQRMLELHRVQRVANANGQPATAAQ